MAALDRTRWQSLEPLLDHALDLSPEDRREWLDTLSRESPTIAADLSSLLESEAAADERGFLSGTLATPGGAGPGSDWVTSTRADERHDYIPDRRIRRPPDRLRAPLLQHHPVEAPALERSSERASKPRSGGIASALLGAAFLMATSAVGPGFLTQTAVFTAQLGASCAFVILASVVFDLAAQLNIWPVIVASGERAQDVANRVFPGLGYLLAALVALGGLAFNIGNVAGAGLGMNVMFGIPVSTGAAISAAIGIAIFLLKEAGRAMDRFALLMGFVMIALTAYVAVASHPPVAEAALRSVAPTRFDGFAIVTLVGGTVGGYITFAGAHRLLDAGVVGADAVRRANGSAITAIGVASLMRVLLFLATLGVVAAGLTLDPANPPASVFRLATGNAGYRIFGVVMWAAAITSVVGAAYTSISFLRGLASTIDQHWSRWVVAFIATSAVVFLLVGRPVRVLVLVGALNGLILPLSLGVMLVAAYQSRIVGEYRHPRWLAVLGALVALAMLVLGVRTLVTELPAFF